MARALALLVALVVLFVSLSAEAKKKKPAKKHKTPTTKSKGKEAAPDSGAETDEASSDEKSSDKDEGDEKTAIKAAPPPPEDEETAAKKPAKPAKAPPKMETEDAGGIGAPIAFRFGVGGKALFRNLSWTDDGGAVAPYTLAPGPQAGLWLEAFPAAFATDGFAANIGLFGHFNLGFGAASKTPAGATLTTKYQDFLAGLKIRFPVGMFIPYIAGAYGMQKFSLEPADATRPNFNYALVSAGAGARIQFTPAIDLDIGASYLFVTNPGSSAGDVASPALYPNATAYGVDASLSLGFRLVSMAGIRAGADFRQIGLATHWKSTDASIRAGGALDRYIAVWGGVELTFDGVTGGGGGESEEASPAKKAPPKAKKPPAEDGEPEVGSED